MSSPGIPNIHGIHPPAPLDTKTNIVENWKSFKQSWENYSVIMNINTQPEAYKVALFLHCIGPEAVKIFNGLSFETPEEKGTLSNIIAKFNDFTIGETNETYERYVFNSRNQKPDESIDAYLTCLRTLAQSCNFCDCMRDTLIRDRIVLGVNNTATRKKLLQQRKLTLKSCIDICRSMESASSHFKVIAEASNKTEDVHAVNVRPKPKARTVRKPKNDRNVHTQQAVKCKFCDGSHPLQKDKCPAWGQKCRKCGGRNHYAKCCRKTEKINQIADQSDTDSDVEFIGSVRENVCTIDDISDCPKEIHAKMFINKKPVQFQIDCGASINILPEVFIDGHEVTPTAKTLIMWNKTEVKPRGTARIIIKNPKNRKKFSVEFVIVRENLTPLLGAKAAQQMRLITINNENFVQATRQSTAGESINQLLTVEQIVNDFPAVFKSELGSFPGEVHLEVDENATPVVAPTRRIPVALREKFKDELDRLEDLNVIAKVDEPTPWVSSVVVATKKNGALRVCIDPKPLNEALKRERYQLPVIDDLLPELSKAKVFSTVDFRSGYWHCILDQESSLLTTFSTPHGRYRWRRLPFGLTVSSEIFQKRVDQVLDRLDGILDITDDILIYGVGTTEQEANEDHDRKLLNLLNRCKKYGVALNPDKVKLRREEVKYMGHIFSNKGLKIDPGKVAAVLEMPRPTDVEAVQRLNGFVNYLTKFLPKIADYMEPIRKLTRKDTAWEWSQQQENAFQEIKRLVTVAPVLSYYDPQGELEVQCDASNKGLGAALLQNEKPVAYASRALTETEQRYATIEKEMLAVVFALEKFNNYTYGRPVTVHSDHKPLESILKKSITCASPRLQRMMMRLQKYNFKVNYKQGKHMYLADTLSRAYLASTEHPSGTEFEIVNNASCLPMSTARIVEIRTATEKDEALQILKQVILQGWPEERKDLPEQAKPYFSIRDELTVQDGLIFRGQRVVIPQSLRQDMKQRIHSSHLGIGSCLRRAREALFWPGMSAEIKELITSCEICRNYETTPQKETLMSHEMTTRPWEQIGADLFTLDGKDYLVTSDYYSNFFEIDRLSNTRASTVILKLKNHFARYGCPERVISDNGPQFSSEEFAQFANQWDFVHRTSSPGNSKANGKAESAVKTAKGLLRKAIDASTDPYLAFLDYRNTPTQGMESSPAQRLLNRRTRTLLPATKQLLQPRVVFPDAEIKDLKKRQQQQAKYYNRSAKDLPPLEEGDTVRMKPFQLGKKTWKKATVVERLDERSYKLEAPEGDTYRRNRCHLRKTAEKAATPELVIIEPVSPLPEPTAPTTTPQTSFDPATASNELTTPARPQRSRKQPAYLRDYIQ